jgi:sodium/potassium-transporting ATPase subunit alpha
MGVILSSPAALVSSYLYLVRKRKKALLMFLLIGRDGEKLTIKADELTVGDIVEIKFGDRVPADIRVLEARSFKV